MSSGHGLSGAAAPLEGGFGAPIRQGGLEARLVAGPGELAALLALRARAFRGDARADDRDGYDEACLHLQVIGPEGAPRAGLRALALASPFAGYAGQFYAAPEGGFAPGVSLELGRLCLEGGALDSTGRTGSSPESRSPGPDTLRLIWAGVARLAERSGAVRLTGCTSFRGTDPAAFAPALGLLAARHLGPAALRPRPLAPETLPLAGFAPAASAAGAGLLPPLLRGYLALGGWVSDHLVIDRALGTFHVFTCVEIAAMPEARKRILRGLAGGA